MANGTRLPLLILLLTSVLMLLAVPTDARWLWGLNHLLYLPVWTNWMVTGLAVMLAVLVILSATTKGPRESSLDRSHEQSDQEVGFYEVPRIVTVAVPVALGVMYFLLEGGFALLGDGASIVAEFREGSTYYKKITELGAYVLTKQALAFSSSFAEPTLAAFRIVAVLSGVLGSFFLLKTAGLIARNVRHFVIFAVTLLSSGVFLIFCGYIEFYSPVWAASAAFLYLALSALRGNVRVGWVLVAWGIACIMHLVAIIFAPAVLYVVLSSTGAKETESLSIRKWIILAGATGICLVLGILALRWSGLDASRLILPLWSEAGKNAPYGLLTPRHTVDFFNILLLIFPGAPALAAIIWLNKRAVRVDRTTTFLILCTVGGLVFLIFVNPALGLARDWDLMSLTLLGPLLLLLFGISTARVPLDWRFVTGYVSLTVMATGLFVGIYQTPASAADRQLDLLSWYGDKDRGGWSILVNFNELYDFDRRVTQTTEEMDRVFPDYRLLRLATAAMRERNLDSALVLARQLVRNDSTQGDFLQLLGAVHLQMGDLRQAQTWYERAAAVKPTHLILKELGLIYLRQQTYDRAYATLSRAHAVSPGSRDITEILVQSAASVGRLDQSARLVDSLILRDFASPTAHLLGIEVRLRQGDTLQAIDHYQAYLKYGRQQRDFENMRARYEHLLSRE